jgi:hypothetical protein
VHGLFQSLRSAFTKSLPLQDGLTL